MSLDESTITLLSYSLVKRSGKVDSFSIHPLVHSWARLYLDSKEERETEIARRAFGILRWAIDVPEERATNDWVFEQRIMLHIDAVAKHMDKVLEIDDDGALTVNLGNVYREHGQYDKALKYYERALAGCEESRGVNHPSTLTMVHNLALVLDNQGQYDKALKYYERALAGKEKSLGVDHPDSLTTVHNMASVFDSQGQYDKALKNYERVLTGCEKSLGVDHPSTLTAVHNMALVDRKSTRLNSSHVD